MHPVALLHPDISPRTVEPFQRVNPDLAIQRELTNPKQIQAAVIFGGDGTVHRYLPGLRESGIPVLVVPAGSGNDFAKALGIWHIKTALAAWKAYCAAGANTRDIDLGLIHSGAGEETLFCSVAAVGMDAEANRRANQLPKWARGRAGYIVSALRTLASFRTCQFDILATNRAQIGPRRVFLPNERGHPTETSGQSSSEYAIHRAGFFVAVGQSQRYGGGLKITPLAELNDGMLDVCFVGKMNKLKVLLAFPTLYFGSHVRLREVDYFRTEQVGISAARPLEVYADGEYICHTPIQISVTRRALRVIMPG